MRVQAHTGSMGAKFIHYTMASHVANHIIAYYSQKLIKLFYSVNCFFSAKPLSIKTDSSKGIFTLTAVMNVLCHKAKYTMIFGLKQTRLGIVYETKTTITDVQPGNFYSFDVNRTTLLPDSNHSLYIYTVTLLNTDGDIVDGE